MKNPLRAIGGDCGYLMAEIVIAIGIFSIGFLAVGSLVIFGTTHNATGNQQTIATLLATEAVERLKSLPIAQLPDSIEPVMDPNNPIDARGNPGGAFTRSWTIRSLSDSNTARRIEVTVSWPRFGQTREVRIATITKGAGT